MYTRVQKYKRDYRMVTEDEEYTFLIPTPQSSCQFKKWAKTTDERAKIERGQETEIRELCAVLRQR